MRPFGPSSRQTSQVLTLLDSLPCTEGLIALSLPLPASEATSRCAQCVDLPWTDTEHLFWNVPCLPRPRPWASDSSECPLHLPAFPVGLPGLHSLQNCQTPPSRRAFPPATTPGLSVLPQPSPEWPSPSVVVISLLFCLPCSLRVGAMVCSLLKPQLLGWHRVGA